MYRRRLKIGDARTREAIKSLRRGMVAIDCGANVGEMTKVFAQRHAEVYAFEPNPDAYAVLESRFTGNVRVHCLPTAVAATDSVTNLYLHQHASSDPVRWSTGSSLFAEKANVDRNSMIEVEAIDLSRFIAELGRPVQLLKLDVEGAEIEVLERLLDSGQLARIHHVLVEMHDTKIPSLTAAGTRLRERLAQEGYVNVLLTWV